MQFSNSNRILTLKFKFEKMQLKVQSQELAVDPYMTYIMMLSYSCHDASIKLITRN